jgi:hypothetical protein
LARVEAAKKGEAVLEDVEIHLDRKRTREGGA